MAIAQVRAQFDGQWYTLTYNETTRRYETYLPPQATSSLQPNGYYNITVKAVNDTGVALTTDGENIPDLKLYVKETVAPVITLVSPTGTYITTGQLDIVFTAVDETGGSGVDISTISVLLDGAAASPEEITYTEMTGGYQITYRPASVIADGSRTVFISVQDIDGNTGTLKLDYIVDTVPPTLRLIFPDGHAVVDDDSVDMKGEVSDAVSPTLTVTITNNGLDMGEVPIQNGRFFYNVPLVAGENRILIHVTDEAGLTTTSELYMIRLITDRTQQDLDSINALLKKALSRWTPEEHAEFLLARARGSYNYTDMNRVVTAMKFLHERFPAYSVGGVQQKNTWGKEEYFRKSTTESYLEDVDKIRGWFSAVMSLPNAPADLEDFTFEEANDIEKILVLVDSLFPLMKKSIWYSGEIFSGEV